MNQDVVETLARLNALTLGAGLGLDPSLPAYLSRAPGRLDVLGGIADYSGSLVLEMPIAEAALAVVQRRPGAGGRLRVLSFALPGADAPSREADVPLRELFAQGASDYRWARDVFLRHAVPWCAYLGGCLSVLVAEHGARVDSDEDVCVLLSSNVPEGRGLSSSAAIEVAAMTALARGFGRDLDPPTLAKACQRVENLVVGVPCGLMDQLTSVCGSAGSLLPILCQPALLYEPMPLPSGLEVWGIDSGVRRAIGDADYGLVRCAAFMGYRIFADELGLAVESGERGSVVVHDTGFRGYLANVDGQTATRLLPRLPAELSGAEFLARFGATTDPVTRVQPTLVYPVRAATQHPIEEHRRALEFRERWGAPSGAERARRLGELLLESHRSMSVCGLGNAATDRLVALVTEAGASSGLFGARVSGGGSGGTVVVLGHPDAAPAVREIARRHAFETGRRVSVVTGSSDGAATFGCRTLRHGPSGWVAL